MTASNPPPPPTPSMSTGKLPLPIASVPPRGTAVFFGSLCVGTFVLGVWQCQRYMEKDELQRQRTIDLHQDPVLFTNYVSDDSNATNKSFRRIRLIGQYDHSREVLVGPRGAPPGVLQDKPGQSGQGMSSSPQGYYVLTPLYLQTHNDDNKDHKNTAVPILINRGWVPRHMVMDNNQHNRGRRNNNNSSDNGQKIDPNQQLAIQQPIQQQQSVELQWNRPTGTVEVTVVPSKTEKPKFLVAEHNFNVRPPILFWFDLSTMLACSGMPFMDNDDATVSISTASGGASKNDTNDRKDGSKSIVLPVYVTQVQDDTLSNKSDSPNTSNSSIVDGLPACPPADKVGEFKVTSAVHAGYAFTWFGLSTAGIYMTRMLLKAKGR